MSEEGETEQERREEEKGKREEKLKKRKKKASCNMIISLEKGKQTKEKLQENGLEEKRRNR